MVKVVKEPEFKEWKEPKTFICSSCGCEFIADNDEYWEKDINSFMRACVIQAFACLCPRCGEETVIRKD